MMRDGWREGGSLEMGGKVKMLTPRQFAALHGVAHTTVANWLQKGLIPEGVKTETPSGHYWTVPETAAVPQLKVGRPATKKRGNT